MVKLRVALSALVSALLVTFVGVSIVSAAAAPPKIDAKAAPVPSWIWAEKTADNQTLGLRGTFELPGDAKAVESATLWASCDDQMVVFVNGKQVKTSTSWAQPVTVDVKRNLVAGRNVVAVLGKNGGSAAGLVAKLKVTLAGGKTVDLVTDDSWQVSTELANGWQAQGFDAAKWAKATILGKYGDGPWGDLPKDIPGAAPIATGEATPAEDIK